jgi:hypothetical protein
MPNIIREEFEYHLAPMRKPGFYVPDDVWKRYLEVRGLWERSKSRSWASKSRLEYALYKAKRSIREYEDKA